MTDATHSADTLLAVDFGAATTRAMLFDVVEGTYRFVAGGSAPSTIEPPYREATEGLRHAVAELRAITGRELFDDNAQLILPSTADGRGADALVATSSAGPAVRVVLVGLLPDASLESARRIAASNYITVVDTFSLGDSRTEAQHIDAILTAKPDVIVVTGGTEDGAKEALLKMLESVGLACHLLPPEHRVKILYAGNSALKDRVSELLGAIAVVHHAPNLQPEMGVENAAPVRHALTQVIETLRLEQIGGFNNIAVWTGGRIHPTAQAASQVVRFFSQAIGAGRGVLNVDVGSAATSVAAGFGGDLAMHVRPDLGVGLHAANVLKETPIEQFIRWVPYEIAPDEMRDFIYNKSAHPHTVPASPEDAYLEYALARETLRAALTQARRDWPRTAKGPGGGLMPWFEFIFGGGAVLAHAPKPALAALLLLDALQPTGLSNLFLDTHALSAALGAIAQVNPTAVVQALDSGAFLTLGTSVSLMGRARPGEVACQVLLETEAGKQTVEVKAGTVEILPLGQNQSGTLTLKPRPGLDVGFGPGRGKTIKDLTGGAVGLIIDARGRPIVFPSDPEQRRAAVKSWLWKAGGE